MRHIRSRLGDIAHVEFKDGRLNTNFSWGWCSALEWCKSLCRLLCSSVCAPILTTVRISDHHITRSSSGLASNTASATSPQQPASYGPCLRISGVSLRHGWQKSEKKKAGWQKWSHTSQNDDSRHEIVPTMRRNGNLSGVNPGPVASCVPILLHCLFKYYIQLLWNLNR